MILKKHYLKSRRGQVLTEQAFVLAAIVGIVLIAVSRLGSQTSSLFDQLSRTFPRLSSRGSGRQPAGKQPKRAPASPTAMAGATGTPGAASATAASKTAGTRPMRGSGGGGLSQAKRNPSGKRSGTATWGVTSTSSSSGALALFVGR